MAQQTGAGAPVEAAQCRSGAQDVVEIGHRLQIRALKEGSNRFVFGCQTIRDVVVFAITLRLVEMPERLFGLLVMRERVFAQPDMAFRNLACRKDLTFREMELGFPFGDHVGRNGMGQTSDLIEQGETRRFDQMEWLP